MLTKLFRMKLCMKDFNLDFFELIIVELLKGWAKFEFHNIVFE